nr:hypothetical protein [Paenibacillus sp. 79R4]
MGNIAIPLDLLYITPVKEKAEYDLALIKDLLLAVELSEITVPAAYILKRSTGIVCRSAKRSFRTDLFQGCK